MAGLEALGFSITSTLLAELAILAVGTGTGLQAVKEFCQFTAIALVIDYALQLTFFVSVLSVDIRRVEVSILLHLYTLFQKGDIVLRLPPIYHQLTDLDDRTISKRVHLMAGEIDDLATDGEDSIEFCPSKKQQVEDPTALRAKTSKHIVQ